MTTLEEGALRFAFGDPWRAERLGRETDTAWKRNYVSDCNVVPVADFGKALPGCSARRIA